MPHEDIHERDVSSELCRLCGACCRIVLQLPDTDSRYRRFLRQAGFTVLPPAKPGLRDCCDQRHDVTLDMGYCRHLAESGEGEERIYRCRIYGSDDYPELCEQYNCVSWAKTMGQFPSGSQNVETARVALSRLRRK